MKKSILISLILLICLSLSACGINDCGDIADYFDDDIYFSKEMTDEEIDTFIQKREEEGFKLSGEINEIVRINNKNNTDVDPEYAYVIEFDEEADAVNLEEHVKQNSKIYCKRFEDIVVYGTSVNILKIYD